MPPSLVLTFPAQATNLGYAERDSAKAQELLAQLQGTLVQMPLRFLEEEGMPNLAKLVPEEFLK